VEAEGALALLSKKVHAEDGLLEEKHQVLTDAQRAMADAERERTVAQQALTAARAAQSAVENERRESVRKLDALTSQLAALAGEQHSSLYGGVRAVVAEASEGRLGGYIGTAAELIHVPSDLETAVEAALGGRLQEVVVETWGDAERAISMLKTAGAGRATFLPLDTLRSPAAQAAPKGKGIIGVARDLVEYEPRLHKLAEALLGRLLIVEDLASARKTLSGIQAGAPWTLATLGGEVVRPGGSVTGGSNTRADDSRAKGKTILARERHRREMLTAQESARSEVAAKEKALESAISAVRASEEKAASTSNRMEEIRKRQVGAQMAHMEQQNSVARLHQEYSWRNGLLSEMRKNIEDLVASLEDMTGQREEIARLLEPQGVTVAESSQRLSDLQLEREHVAQGTGEGQMRLAVLSEARRNVHARQNEARREAAQVSASLLDIERRLSETTIDEREMARRLEEQAREVALLAEQLASTEAEIAHSERQVRVLEGEVSRIEDEQTALQAALLESETTHSRSAVERQRCVGTLDSLRVEIIEEVGGGSDERNISVLPEEGNLSNSSALLRWPLAGRDGVPPEYDDNAIVSTEETAERERRIYALKSRLSRLGPVNPLAMEEHAALAERHSYLQEQLTDLVSAAESLRRVIAELDRTMRDQFAATFDQVNEAFQHFFNKLFGGGTARLELTNPMDVSASGVEILAQPPGKRMQPLAALSGGERALTSAALLFALLRVRPVPFCVLDEVDAALDETNVTRFRSALQELGQKTQFVVITHNRGTIEAADTLYGISMAGDGTSQMLSLKVEAA
jgi:chromosome segregation protein